MKVNRKAIIHAEPLQCKETAILFDSSHGCYILTYWDEQDCSPYECEGGKMLVSM